LIARENRHRLTRGVAANGAGKPDGDTVAVPLFMTTSPPA
jgi:hypothetical protein